ncbi:hypothetical protein M5G07_00600 [Serratia symbiotica]|nr:hypothetical protein [Serratia symbiotica]
MLTGITTGLSLLDPQNFDQLRFWQDSTLDIRTLASLSITAPDIFARCLADAGYRSPAKHYQYGGRSRHRAWHTDSANPNHQTIAGIVIMLL